MGPRCARRHNNAVKAVLLDSLFDFIDAALGAAVEVSLNESHMGQGFRVFGESFHIQVSGNIGSAMADKHPDPGLFFILFKQRPSPSLKAVEGRFQQHVLLHLMPELQIREYPWATLHNRKQKPQASLCQQVIGGLS
jgi:hypothetical protein